MEILSMRDYYEVIIYTLAIVCVVIINTFLFLQSKKTDLVQYFFRLQVLMGLWMVAKIFKVITADTDAMWLWVLVEYFGICYFSIELLAFGYIYKYSKKLKRKNHTILTVIASINYFVLFTNHYHHLFYQKILLVHSIKGPYFYVHTTFSYCMILIGIYFIISSDVNKSFLRKEQVMLFLGLLLPLLVNTVYIFKIVKIPYDFTPIIFNVMILNFGIIAFRHNYFDVQGMTRNMIIENLFESIIILDKDNRIIEYNKKTVEMMSPVTKIKKYSSYQKLFEDFKPYIVNYEKVSEILHSFLSSTQTQTQTELELHFNDRISNYVFSFQKTYSKYGEYTGSIIKLIDLSEYHQLVREFKFKNDKLREINRTLNENISVKKRLVSEQERNRASKEVHDILGHSVTLVISLLEMIKATYVKEPDFAREKIIQSMDITRNGLSELKQSLTKKKDLSIDSQTLIDDLERLTEEFSISGVDVEFITNHYNVKIRPKYYDTIYRICQESMTNALRHGEASKITIAVRFSDKSVDIIIVDNGLGCLNFTKGNGIRGMEQRVDELNGFFSCGSPDGEGFNLHVTIPINRELSNLNEAEPMI